MKNFFKRFLALSLIFMLIMSSFSYADNSAIILKDTAGPNGLKISEDLRNLDIDDNDEVRIIVELTQQPIIKHATLKGVKVVELSTSEITTLSNKIQLEQDIVIEEISTNEIDANIHQTFQNVFNGFSLTVKYGEIDKIANIENVKKVYISNRYERPEPQMSSSHKLTQSKYVNEDLGYKGEGIVVAIIDTGIDPSHKDFKLDEGTYTELDKTKVDKLVSDNALPGEYYTYKVPYGYNYMDNNKEIKDLGADASMHGMHVAGTVAANGELQGVAPNAQVLAMKVFGNDPEMPSTFGDVIIAAIEDSIILGADVMNLSLGSTASFVDTTDPEQMAVTNAVDNGIVMSISAGNSAYFGNGYDLPYAQNPDIGVVGSPGLTSESIQIASIDNFTYLYKHDVNAEGLNLEVVGFGKDAWTPGTYELVAIGGTKLGQPSDYDGLDVKGKVVLVSRGAFSFYDKTENASFAGAKAIIVYNNNPKSQFHTDQGGWSIPFMKTQVAEGLELEALIEANGGSIDIEVSLNEEYVSPVTGKLSSFSSWGVTPSLDFKPELAAPGGNIYSTLNNNSYGYMSGTSMAAPHASGGAALVVERINEDSMFNVLNLTGSAKANFAKNILMNTAKPVVDYDYTTEDGVVNGHSYTSVRRQGAGAMDLKAAMETTVVITEKNSGIAKVNAGEVTDNFSFELVATNYSAVPADFVVSSMAQINSNEDGYNLLVTELLENVNIDITVAGQPVGEILTVPANGSVTVKFDFDISKATTADGDTISEAFANGNFVEGYAFFSKHDTEAATNKETKKIAYEAAIKTMEDQEAVVAALLAKQVVALANADASAKEIADAISEITKYDTENSVLIAKNAYVIEAVNAYNLAKEELDALVALNPTIGVDKTSASEALNTLKNDKADLDAAKIILETELVALNAELVVLQGQLAELDVILDAEAYTAKATEISVKVTAIADKETELATNATSITDKEATIVTSEAELATLTAISNSIATATQAVEAAELAKQNAEAELTLEEKASYSEYLTVSNQLKSVLASKKAIQVNVAIALEKANKEYDNAVDILDVFKTTANTALDNYNNANDVYDNSLPLSVPYVAFAGDWGDAPAFDSPLYEDDTFYGLTGLYHVSENSEDFLGFDGENYDGTKMAISPNGDGSQDSTFPILSVLRNVKNVEYNILTKEGTLIRTLAKEESLRKNYFDAGQGSRYYFKPAMEWDGTANLVTLPDGDYIYEVKGVLADDDSTVHSLEFPIKIDTKDPELERHIYNNGSESLEVIANDDGGSGINEYILLDLSKGDVKVLSRSKDGLFDLSDLEHRSYLVTYAVTDFAGNMSMYNEVVIINDSSNPEVRLSVEAFGIINEKEFTLTGTVSDMNAPEITLDGEKVEIKYNPETGQVEFEKDYTYNTDGKKGIVVGAEDLVGNAIEFTRYFYIDSTPAVITVDSGDVIGTDKVVYVENTVTTIELSVEVEELLFPDLEVKYNGDVLHSEGKDFVSYEDAFTGVSYAFEKTVTLVDGENRILIEAKDAGGNVTVYDHTVIRLADGEVAPSNFEITDLTLTKPEGDVSSSRPVEYSFTSSEVADWIIEVVNPDGDVEETFKAPNVKTATGSWAPLDDKKLNGEFKFVVKAVSGESTVTKESAFEVYNYPVRINEIKQVTRAGMLMIEVELENLEATNQNPLVVIQVRKSDNTVLSITTAQAKVIAGETGYLSTGIKMPSNDSYTVEVFIWDQWELPKTLSEQSKYQFIIE